MFLDERKYGTTDLGLWFFWPEARRLIADRIEAEARPKESVGQPKRVDQQGESEDIEEKPPEYKFGPLCGKKKDVSLWIRGTPLKNDRILNQKKKSARIWVIRRLAELEVWFKVEDDFRRAEHNRQSGLNTAQ
jgi:hypothetical protein